VVEGQENQHFENHVVLLTIQPLDTAGSLRKFY
jgi:hypothetical protein